MSRYFFAAGARRQQILFSRKVDFMTEQELNLAIAPNEPRRWLPLAVTTLAALLTVAFLAVAFHDPLLGLTALGGVAVVGIPTAGLYGYFIYHGSDVVVRVDDIEVCVHVVNSPQSKKQLASILIEVAEFTIRRIRSTAPSRSPK
jgi:hypothetical protein